MIPGMKESVPFQRLVAEGSAALRGWDGNTTQGRSVLGKRSRGLVARAPLCPVHQRAPKYRFRRQTRDTSSDILSLSFHAL